MREVLGRAVLRGKQGCSLTCRPNLVLLTQAAKGGQPRACRVSPAPSKPGTFSPLPRNVAPAPSFRKPTKPRNLRQQHPCPWGCGPRRVSFRTPQSLPLAEIACSEHKHHACHCRRTSSTSREWSRLLQSITEGFHRSPSVCPSPSAWPRGVTGLPGGRREAAGS